MRRKTFQEPIIHLLVIALFGMLAYSNTFHVPFQFDDEFNIVGNPLVKDLGYYAEPSEAIDVWRDHYTQFRSRIVGYLTFALNYTIHGIDVTGYHVFNLAVHLLNAFLVYALVVVLFRTPFLQNSTELRHARHMAFFSGLLFVSHPIETQAVTYIVQRFASLATLFYLAAFLSYIKSRLSTRAFKRRAFYVLTLALTFLSLKTKEFAVTLPVTIVVLELSFFRDSLKKRILYLIPMALLLVTVPLSYMSLGKTAVETTKVHTSISRLDYLFTQFAVVATYIRLLLFPVNQNVDYDYPIYESFFNLEVVISFLFLVSIAALGLILFVRSRHETREMRLVAFGIFFFFITLLPESGLIPIVDIIFEHRAYLPSVGAFIAISVSLIMIWKRHRYGKTLIFAVPIFLAIIFSSATFSRNEAWKSNISLWEDVVKKSPNKARGHNDLGNYYKSAGLFGKAVEQYELALNAKPNLSGLPLTDSVLAGIHFNLGELYSQRGNTSAAIEQFVSAVKLKPDYEEAQQKLAQMYMRMDQYDKAVEHFRIAIEMNPNQANYYNNLGFAYYRLGMNNKAVMHLRTAIRLKPSYAKAHLNLCLALRKMGMMEEVRKHERIAKKLNPALFERYLSSLTQ